VNCKLGDMTACPLLVLMLVLFYSIYLLNVLFKTFCAISISVLSNRPRTAVDYCQLYVIKQLNCYCISGSVPNSDLFDCLL